MTTTTATTPTATIIEAVWSAPINARHGYYVKVRCNDAALRDGTARRLANATAAAAGYAAEPFTVGAPVWHGRNGSILTGYLTVAHWYGRR